MGAGRSERSEWFAARSIALVNPGEKPRKMWEPGGECRFLSRGSDSRGDHGLRRTRRYRAPELWQGNYRKNTVLAREIVASRSFDGHLLVLQRIRNSGECTIGCCVVPMLGCNVVYTSKPIGEKPSVISSEDWKGV